MAFNPYPSPEEQLRQVMAWYPNKKLYHRVSSKSGKALVSVYPENSSCPIYSHEEWYADDYTSPFLEPDFKRSFFEQFAELQAIAPVVSLLSSLQENAEYCQDVEGVKNGYIVFDAINCRDVYYSVRLYNSNSCADVYWVMESELLYDCTYMFSCYNCRWCFNCKQASDSDFLFDCRNVSRCFMSSGLRNKQYCVRNQQLTKEEYEALLPRIIEHMQKTGEWGEFFPPWLSPFAYNETVAQDYLPLREEEAETLGYQWKNKIEKAAYQGPRMELPDSVQETDESICKQILTCEQSGENYKIIPQELRFYKEQNLPLPRRSPNQRFLDRVRARNPRFLWNRPCQECGMALQSSYAPERPERVLCEACYLKAVD